MSFTDKSLFTFTPLNKNKTYFLYILIYLLLITLIQLTGHGGDTYCWYVWSNYIQQHGIGKIFEAGSNYPPLYYYILSGYGHLMGSEEAIMKNIYWLKPITFLFEFGSVFLLFRYLKKDLQPWFFLFIILNPGFIYNSLIWGQVDGLFGFFTISMILLAVHRQNTLALLCFILCLNFKIQSIIFLPLLICILLHNIADYKGFLHGLYVLLAVVALQLFILLPFIGSNTVDILFTTLINSVGKYPAVSMNAYNMYYWFFDGNLTEIQDTGTWNGFNYKTWGLLCFIISSVFALIPVFIISIVNAFQKGVERFKDAEKIFLSAALVSLAFFFFNTQMHERYSHYALIFLAAYFAVSENYLPFLLCALACFLNEEAVLQALRLQNYETLIFNPEFIAGLFALVIIYLYYLLYKSFDLQQQFKSITDLKGKN